MRTYLRSSFVGVVLLGALLIFSSPVLASADTAVVRGVLTENAAVMKLVVNAKVTIAGVPATVSGQGFTVANVPVGMQSMVASAPGHVTLKKTIDVLPGQNTLTVALAITVGETYRRYFNAYNHARFRVAYRMVHPDVRRHQTLSQFAASIRPFLPWLSMRIVGIKTLAKWRPQYLGKTYYNVKAVDRVLRYKCIDGVCAERGVRHWDRISGRWYLISNWH